jgi:hypothetical protein
MAGGQCCSTAALDQSPVPCLPIPDTGLPAQTHAANCPACTARLQLTNRITARDQGMPSLETAGRP